MTLTPQLIAEGLTDYVVMLFSLSVHESAHAWMAQRLGDDTAALEGRISLNPLVHIDPIGTVLMPLLGFLSAGQPLFGWAKPTPYRPENFGRNVSLGRGHILVAVAGPLSNLLLAALFTFGLFVIVRTSVGAEAETPLLRIVRTGILLNVVLAVFNLVPLPPLDGSKVASWGLPRALGEAYDRIAEPYGPWILMILMFSGAFSWILLPIWAVTLAVVRFVVS